MTPKALTLSKYIARASVVLVVAMGASGCSSVPDWVDPTTWVGGSDNRRRCRPIRTSRRRTRTRRRPIFPPFPTSRRRRRPPTSRSRSRTRSLPTAAKPNTAPMRCAAAQSLRPRRLRLSSASERGSRRQRQCLSGRSACCAAPDLRRGPQRVPERFRPTAARLTAAPAASPAPAAVASESMPPPAVAPASSSMPAVPAVGPQVASGDASLGFRPSSAPPLDGSVAQFVAPSIMARYQQTAAITGGNPAVPATGTAYASNSKRSRRTGRGRSRDR